MTISKRPDPFDSPFFRSRGEAFDRDFERTERRIWRWTAVVAGVLTVAFYLVLIAAMVLGVIWLWGQVR